MPPTNEVELRKSVTSVKVCSWILLILGILGTVASLFVLVTGPLITAAAGSTQVVNEVSEQVGSDQLFGVSVDTGIATVGVLITIIGVVALLSGVLDIITGALGLRGAKDPSKLGPYLVLCWISLVLAIVSLVMTCISAASGGASDSLITDLSKAGATIVFSGCCIFYGNRLRQYAAV